MIIAGSNDRLFLCLIFPIVLISGRQMSTSAPVRDKQPADEGVCQSQDEMSY